jgi:hypothetical protein
MFSNSLAIPGVVNGYSCIFYSAGVVTEDRRIGSRPKKIDSLTAKSLWLDNLRQFCDERNNAFAFSCAGK